MKRTVATLAALTALVAVWSGSLPAATPAALLLSFSGDVSVHRSDGAVVKASYGLQLEAGDEVRTGPGAEAEIHFENGTWIKLGPGSDLKVKGSGSAKRPSEPENSKGSFESLSDFLKLRDAGGVSTLAALRSGEKRPEIRLESPCQTRVRGDRPVFTWSATDSTAELRLKLYDERGVRWQQDVKGARAIRYPADREPLVAGIAYSWTLETTDPLKFPPLRTPAAFFEVMPADEARRVEAAVGAVDRSSIPSESAYRIVLASIYFDHRLLDDAIAETAGALAIDPDNRDLHAILARLYAETGRSEEAMSEYDKLLETR
jgi:hypothetical protein